MNCLVIGAGSWGSALSQVLSDNRHSVEIFANKPEAAEEINAFHTNKAFFGANVRLNPAIKATTDLKSAVNNKDVIVLSVPCKAYKEVLSELDGYLTGKEKPLIVSTAKGFDPVSLKRLSVLIEENLPAVKVSGVVSIIGPSFASEVVVRQLTCLCAVSADIEAALRAQKLFSNDYFRVYANDDVIGAEYAAAIKNVIAIASGILYGLGYKDNARAALITRGLNEMARFGVHQGGKKETYLGLTGLGDLMMTCTSLTSRNFQAGLAIGRADSAEEFLKTNEKTVEGIMTSKVIYQKSSEEKIDMPIVKSVYQVLFEHKKPSEIIPQLMKRSLKKEF